MSNVGSEVLAYCSQCKMDLTAVVVAKEGGKIAKVMCKTCKKERSYKNPKGVKDPGSAIAAAEKKVRTPTQKTEVKTVSVEVEWNRQMGEAKNAKRVVYSADAKLEVGVIVKHPTFGDGIVQKIVFPNKAEILFRNDLKLLIHSL